MKAKLISADFIHAQQRSFNTLMDTMISIQNQAESTNRLLADQMGVNQEAQDIIEQWRVVLKKGRDDFKTNVNEAYTLLQRYYANLDPKDDSEHQTKPQEKQSEAASTSDKPSKQQAKSANKKTDRVKRQSNTGL